jgi:hypothetical protein
MNPASFTRHFLKHRLAIPAAALLSTLPHAGHAQSWQDISANVPGQLTEEQYQVAASDGSRLYVLGRQGVFMSADDGATFTAINDVAGGLPSLGLASFRFIKFVNGEVWLGGSSFADLGQPPGPRLFRLTPGETVWQASSGGIPGDLAESNPEDIAYDSVSGNYYVTMASGGVFIAGPVYVSTDGGNTWQARTNGISGQASPTSVVATQGSILMSRPLRDVFRSTDSGENWSLVLPGTSDGAGPMIQVQDRALLWRGVNADFSDDGGLTWNTVRPLPSLFTSNAILSSDGDLVLACTRGGLAPGTLAYSASGGIAWQNLTTTGLPPVESPASPTAGTGYMPNFLMRHGDFLFVTGVSRNSSFFYEAGFLHRLDVSAFTFENPLQIAIQPQPRTLLVGQSHVLQVYASGPGLTYQWRKNGVDLPGETNRVLNLDDAQVSDSGDYQVIVTSGATSLPSAVATVTVVGREDGRWDPLFDQTSIDNGGRVHLLESSEAIVVRPTSSPLAIYRIGADGTRLQNRTWNTTTSSNQSNANSLLDANGKIIISLKPNSNTTQLQRYNSATFDFEASVGIGSSNSSSLRIQDLVEVPGRGYAIVGNFDRTSSLSGVVNVKNFALIGYDFVTDPDFPGGTGPNISSAQTSVTCTTDGSIYVAGGGFTSWSGVATPRSLVRIDSTGTIHAVNTGIPGTSDASFVHALDDGRILILFGTSGARQLYALQPGGAVDPTFNTAGHTITDIRGVAQQADGKIILVGNFSSFGGTTAAGYIRLHPDGSVDDTFHTATGFSHGTINEVTYDPRGYIYLSSTSSSSSGTFQGQPLPNSRGPVRIFATAAHGGPGGGFTSWPALLDLPENQRGPNDTPAGDGVPNLVKYAIGVGPLDSAAGRIPQEVVEGSVNDETYPVVSFVRDKSATGVAMQVEAATGLDFASDLGTTVISTEDLGDGTERITVRSNARFADHARQFFRLAVMAE